MNNEKIYVPGSKVFTTNSSTKLNAIITQGNDIICNLDEVEISVETVDGMEGQDVPNPTEPVTQFQYTSVLIPNGKFYPAEFALQIGTNVKCQEYLDNTDWYVTRKLETGVEIPAEILQKREECRQQIIK